MIEMLYFKALVWIMYTSTLYTVYTSTAGSGDKWPEYTKMLLILQQFDDYVGPGKVPNLIRVYSIHDLAGKYLSYHTYVVVACTPRSFLCSMIQSKLCIAFRSIDSSLHERFSDIIMMMMIRTLQIW